VVPGRTMKKRPIRKRALSALKRLVFRRGTLLSGQLRNSDFEKLLSQQLSLLASTVRDRSLNIVEVGTGSGKGSTISVYEAAKRLGQPFTLTGYECNPDLYQRAADQWKNVNEVRIVHEFFMAQSDFSSRVYPHILPGDQEEYRRTFQKYESATNFFSTPPATPVDLLVIDSVRYTHLAAVTCAQPFLSVHSIVVMEDDIPDYGETKILERHLALKDLNHHPIANHDWPIVSFRLR